MWEQTVQQPPAIQRRSLPANQQTRIAQRPRQPTTYDTEDDDAIYTTRSPRSAIALAPRGRTFVEPVTQREPPKQRKTFVFPGWLLVIGIAVIVMIVGWFAFNFIGS